MLTQNKMIITWLENGKMITQDLAKEMFGVFRLASRIYDLKCSGYDIKKEMIEVVNRFGEKVKIARYWI